MTSSVRSTALANAAQQNLQAASPANESQAAGIAAVTRLWQYYNHPHILEHQCYAQQTKAFVVLLVLGLGVRILVWCLAKVKVARKAQE